MRLSTTTSRRAGSPTPPSARRRPVQLVEHEPWPLYRAVVRELEGNLVAAARQPDPKGKPVVRWSPGVRTRIGWSRPLRRA